MSHAPSGDQTGSAPGSGSVSPEARSRTQASPMSMRDRLKASLLPSGDQRGPQALPHDALAGLPGHVRRADRRRRDVSVEAARVGEARPVGRPARFGPLRRGACPSRCPSPGCGSAPCLRRGRSRRRADRPGSRPCRAGERRPRAAGSRPWPPRSQAPRTVGAAAGVASGAIDAVARGSRPDGGAASGGLSSAIEASVRARRGPVAGGHDDAVAEVGHVHVEEVLDTLRHRRLDLVESPGHPVDG